MRGYTAEKVAEWFRHPRGKPWPERRHVAHMVAVLSNLPAQTAATLAVQASARERLRAVKAAIDLLAAELPGLIANAETHHRAAAAMGRPSWRSRETTTVPAELLLAAVTGARNLFPSLPAPNTPGRKRPWRPYAEVARFYAELSWRVAGRTTPLGFHRTGPLVGVIHHALEALGTPAEQDAISKWLEDTKKRNSILRT